MATTTTTASEPITADNILQQFPDIDTTSDALSGHDDEQIRLMDEVCIVLDENDIPIGKASKKICQYTTQLPLFLLPPIATLLSAQPPLVQGD